MRCMGGFSGGPDGSVVIGAVATGDAAAAAGFEAAGALVGPAGGAATAVGAAAAGGLVRAVGGGAGEAQLTNKQTLNIALAAANRFISSTPQLLVRMLALRVADPGH